MTIGRTFCGLVAALCLVAAGYAVSRWYPGPWQEKTPAHNLRDDDNAEKTTIRAQGRLEPVSGTLALGAIPGEQIVQLDAFVGKEVTKGAVLAVLGSHELRTNERILAERQLEKAKLQITAEIALADIQKDLAQISLDQAKASAGEIPPQQLIVVANKRLDLAKARLGKLEQLRKDPRTQEAVAQAEVEQQQLLIEQIQVELQENQAKLDAANINQDLAMNAAQKKIALAGATRESLTTVSPFPVLDQTVKLAELAESASEVCAPCDGTVLEVYARQGERVANAPILQMGDLRQMVCVAEIHENDLRKLQSPPGPDADAAGRHVPARQFPAEMRSAALGRDSEGKDVLLRGNVVEIGLLVGAPALRDPNPLAQTDRRTARVRIELDKASTAIARDFVHMQVNVTIRLSDTEAPKQ